MFFKLSGDFVIPHGILILMVSRIIQSTSAKYPFLKEKTALQGIF
jgi:hypothetical protein